MNRKMLFVSSNITIIKTRFQKFSNSLYPAIFKMHDLYIIWLGVFQFITCKVGVDAFSWLYSKLLLAMFCIFVIGAFFVASH